MVEYKTSRYQVEESREIYIIYIQVVKLENEQSKTGTACD